MKIFNSIVKYNRILEEVDLSGSQIGNEGIETLTKNLGRNKGLQILKLSNVGIDDQSSKHLYDLISNNKQLKSLDISDN